MQNTKDTFYELLRSRLAALNPYRTIVLRGVTRPGVLVVENELLSDITLPDCFRLRWTDAAIDPLGTLTLQCAIDYETAGTTMNSSMDRGRALAAMDAELAQIINPSPQNTVKTNYTALSTGGSAVPMQANIWWGNVAFTKTEIKNDRIARTATVEVMSYAGC